MPDSDFASGLRALGIDADAALLAAFATYRDLIVEAAARFNLTAVRDPGEMERRHFLEALALGLELERRAALPAGPVRVIDIGSGAGFPGLPLKLLWRDVQLSLLESNEKRCRFLRDVIARLAIDGAAVLEGRAETWARDREHRDGYDLALARAVAPLPILLEYALPFLRPGGLLAAQKGSAAAREQTESARALEVLGGEIEYSGGFEPPGGSKQTLLLVRKLRATPERYPRRPGAPTKRPIA